MYRIISSGSTGNAVLYHESILVDIGVPFASISGDLYNIQLVLLTHEHKDHLNISTLKTLAANRPTLRIGCCEWMLPHVEGLRNVDVYSIGQVYDYGHFQVSPVKLYHNVPNCGYRIFKNNYSIFHATDTAHLQGIEAKNYSLYAVEHNFDEDSVFDKIDAMKQAGEFAYQDGAVNTHLSEQKARDFIYKNAGPNSQVIRLHESRILK